MPFTKFTNLDFDQIKVSLKDYIRSNSNFTDFDFEGSNFSVLIDTLAYNTYINAFNANLVVNESFLDVRQYVKTWCHWHEISVIHPVLRARLRHISRLVYQLPLQARQ